MQTPNLGSGIIRSDAHAHALFATAPVASQSGVAVAVGRAHLSQLQKNRSIWVKHGQITRPEKERERERGARP